MVRKHSRRAFPPGEPPGERGERHGPPGAQAPEDWPRRSARVTLRAAFGATFGVPVAQRIERPPSKRQVVGSSPTGDAKLDFVRGTTRRLIFSIMTGVLLYSTTC